MEIDPNEAIPIIQSGVWSLRLQKSTEIIHGMSMGKPAVVGDRWSALVKSRIRIDCFEEDCFFKFPSESILVFD